LIGRPTGLGEAAANEKDNDWEAVASETRDAVQRTPGIGE